MTKRKTTHVKIKYKDGKEYNIRRGRVHNVASYNGDHWIILTKDWITRKTPFGFYKKHKEIYVKKEYVEMVEQTNLDGKVIVYKEEE